MKKIRALLIVAIMMALAFFLFACGRSNANEEIADTDKNIEEDADDDMDVDMEEDADDDMDVDFDEEEDDDSSIEFEHVFYQITDQDGYIYEVDYFLSPWMLVSDNENMILAAWDEVSFGEDLPFGYDDWYLEDEGNYMSRDGILRGNNDAYLALSMNDMYYCVGYVYIQNVTEGWDITDDRNVESVLAWGEDPGMYIKDFEAQVIGRMYYSNDIADYSNCVDTIAHLTDNDWGPKPFVIMAPENFSPKYPDGEYLDTMINSPFTIAQGSERYSFNVGVYGKDGIYYEASAE